MSPKVIAPFQIARLLVGERSAFLLLGLAALVWAFAVVLAAMP